MVKYETPRIEVIKFNIDNKVMNDIIDGYGNGDECDNPWAGLFADTSAEDEKI